MTSTNDDSNTRDVPTREKHERQLLGIFWRTENHPGWFL